MLLSVAALTVFAVVNRPPGLQGDEAFFLIALRQPEATACSVEIPGLGTVSLMVNSYVGTVKAAIMGVIFRVAGPSVLALRLFGDAALLLGGLLFHRFARRHAPAGIALLFTAALLTDPTYAVTSVLDWGPVALQHVFFLLTLIAAAAAAEHRSGRWAVLAGVSAGLGVWDKALFIFPLFGLLFALLLLSAMRGQWREWRLLIPAAAGLAIAAAPFFYSLTQRHPGPAAADLARFDAGALSVKADQLARALDGTSIRGFLTNAGASVSIAAGSRTLLPFACVIALAMAIPVRRSRHGQFAIATLAGALAAWVSMALVRDAAIGVHHTVLLWPAPYLFLLFAGLAWRERWPRTAPALLTLAGVLALQNARVTADLRRAAMEHGFNVHWSDAQYRLAERLAQLEGAVLLGDWALEDAVYFASRGRLFPRKATDEFWKSGFDAADIRKIKDRLRAAEPLSLVYRTPADAFFPGVRPAVERAASELGLVAAGTEIVRDRVGAPRFEIVAYRRP